MTRVSDICRSLTVTVTVAVSVAVMVLGALTLTPSADALPASHGAASPVPHVTARSVFPDLPTPLTDVMPADPANPDNPLAGMRWGTYLGLGDHTFEPWMLAHGATKKALGVIAKTPKPRWFGNIIPNLLVAAKVKEYIEQMQGGDPDVMVQMALTRMDPWENLACSVLPTKLQQLSYKQYVTSFARAVGDTHAAIIVQPDGPFARCAPHHSKLRMQQMAWTVHQLAQLPNAAVYIEMGSADWFRGDITDPVRLLMAESVKEARGFALDTSHYDALPPELEFGDRIVTALAARGAGDKHFVVDTSDNGRGFGGDWYHQHYGKNAVLGHAPACRTKQEKHCVTLGVRPTTDVAEATWGLSKSQQKIAAEHVDAYLWIAHPWMHWESFPYDVKRAVALVRTTPYH